MGNYSKMDFKTCGKLLDCPLNVCKTTRLSSICLGNTLPGCPQNVRGKLQYQNVLNNVLGNYQIVSYTSRSSIHMGSYENVLKTCGESTTLSFTRITNQKIVLCTDGTLLHGNCPLNIRKLLDCPLHEWETTRLFSKHVGILLDCLLHV